jgi:hypothetical protein
MKLEDRIRDGFEPIHLPRMLATVRSAGRRKRRARTGAWIASVLAGAVMVALVAPTIRPGGQSSAAARTLRQLSLTAAAQPVVSIGAGQYLYSRFQARWQSCNGNGCVWQPNVREDWVAPDGSGRSAGRRGPVAFSELKRPGELGVDPKVPTDQDALRGYVEDRASHADQPLHYEMFVVIADLLRESFSSPVLYSSPGLRPSLFEVAATLPGVEALGAVSDEKGRPGIGVGFIHDGTRLELIFDPDTSAILGEREVRISDGETIPGSWIVYLESGVVDSTDERP